MQRNLGTQLGQLSTADGFSKATVYSSYRTRKRALFILRGFSGCGKREIPPLHSPLPRDGCFYQVLESYMPNNQTYAVFNTSFITKLAAVTIDYKSCLIVWRRLWRKDNSHPLDRKAEPSCANKAPAKFVENMTHVLLQCRSTMFPCFRIVFNYKQYFVFVNFLTRKLTRGPR